jgi:hypothetical protein
MKAERPSWAQWKKTSSIALIGCKSKAQKQAEAAVPDLARLEKLVAERHVESIARALPAAATAVGAKLGDKAILPTEAAAITAAIDDVRNKTEDLRSSKRSYFAVCDNTGVIVACDDSSWNVLDRKLGIAFPAIHDVLAGKSSYASGTGRYGGADPEALTLFGASPIVRGDKPIGALICAWEIHEIAEDLQRQLQTDLAMKTVKPKARAKPKDKYQLALDTPDLWVAVFDKEHTWLQEGAPQPLEDAAKALGLHGKTAGGDWTGTFDVMNKGWGGAARRFPKLGPEMGVAVLRHDP